jgi:hypothetical protein
MRRHYDQVCVGLLRSSQNCIRREPIYYSTGRSSRQVSHVTLGEFLQISLFLLSEFGVRGRIKTGPASRGIGNIIEDVSSDELELGVHSVRYAQCMWQCLFRKGRTIERYEQGMKHVTCFRQQIVDGAAAVNAFTIQTLQVQLFFVSVKQLLGKQQSLIIGMNLP